MHWPRSLRNRIFAASSLLAVLPILGAFVFVSGRVTRQAERELHREVVDSARRLDEQHRARLEALIEMAHLVADLPKLKAAVATGDPPTVAPLARDYRRRLRCDLLILTDDKGRSLAAIGTPSTAVPATASRANLQVAFRSQDGRDLETISVAIVVGPEPVERLGTLTIGFRLDDALAAQTKRLIDSDVVFLREGLVRGGTLPHSQEAELASLPEGEPALVLDGAFLALKQPMLATIPDAPRVVVLRSRAESLRFLRTLRWALAVAALAALGVAVVLSYAVARTVTRPLAALTAEMGEIARTGDLTRRISPGGRWDDEDARLLERTFNTLTASIARFQREFALKERLSALGRLSTVVAHEVRNPLMIIKTTVRVLRRADLSADERRDAADDIDHEVARLDRIVGDVLDYARPPRVEIAPVDLAALCRECREPIVHGEPPLTCEVDVDPAAAVISTDPARLHTVLANVLQNARDSVLARGVAHKQDGRPAEADIRVHVRKARSGEVEIVIADCGTGITPEDLPHLFEPYFTTRRTGTGLGLAIAKRIVEALGGSIDAASLPDRGAELRIVLPAQGPREGAQS